jgi:hypothetical protein
MDLLPGLWINKTRQVVLLIWWVLLIDANWLQNDLQTNNNIKTNLNHKLQIIVNENKISAYLQSNYLFNKHSNLWNEQNEYKLKLFLMYQLTICEIILLRFFLVFGFFFIYMNEKMRTIYEITFQPLKWNEQSKLKMQTICEKTFHLFLAFRVFFFKNK